MLFGQTIQHRFAFTVAIGLSQIVFVWTASAQEVDARLVATRRQGAAALEALQSKDMAAALKSLGEAADSSPGIHPSENDGLAAAAGGLHRALVQLTSDEQYDLLYAWTMPTEARPSVRILTTLAPHNAPPKEFARVLGERPRETSFPVSEIGGVRGLFSTGWTLVVAADEIGRLRRLTAELEQLVQKNTPNADVLLMLARLAERRGDPAALSEGLQQRAAALRIRFADGANAAASADPSDILLAAAALRHESLRPISEEIFKLLADLANKGAVRLRPFLRIAQATAAQLHHGVSGPEALYENRLKYWVPISGTTAETSSAGAPSAMWLTHEDHVLHLAGAGNDVLFFRYPLSGDFDFTCETQVGGEIGTEGGLVYGGLHFEALGSPEVLTVRDGDLLHQVRRPCPFVRQESRPIFNRVSIRPSDEGAVFAANLHPIWFDGPSSKTSPWLGLRSFGERRPLFRNLKITGNPVIPREVRLSEGDQLRGWQAGFFGETQPLFAGASPPGEPRPMAAPAVVAASPAEFDWSIQAGVIRAARRAAPEGTTSQSLLKYHRPLLEGESVTYEFHYQPGQFEVHPALGRLAFLIEPDGVRIHWITAGQFDWSGLPAGNATLEPLNRRGPRPLPLKMNEWNQIALARTQGKATISLNGELIYERLVDDGDLTFGLYRDAARSAVEVRNVVMTGDWPESLPEEFLQNPAAVVSQLPDDADRRVLNRAAGDEFLAENVREVRRRAVRLDPVERFDDLARWVLAGADQPGFRMSGEFTPTDPSPLAVKREPERFASPRGGELVSPVFDLLDAASEAEKLGELRNRIAAVPDSPDEEQQRAKAALLLLVNLTIGDNEAATAACEVLQELVLQASPDTAADMWPETLAVYGGFSHFQHVPAVGDLVNSLYSRRTQRSFPGGCENWHARITFLMERYRRLAAGVTEGEWEASTHFDHWVSMRRISARPRGDGFPHTVWVRGGDGEALHLSGHHEDYLVFRSPLRGDFEMVGDMGADATTQLFAAGRYFGPRWRREEFEMGLFRQGHWIETISPPFAHLDPWIRYRVVVRDRVRTVYINGRPMHTEELPEHHDPWFGARAWSRAVARLRNVQIAGEPQIPDSVLLSASEQLLGWVPYFDAPAEGEGAVWRHAADAEIHGVRRAELDGSFCESLLGYCRPLAESGAIEFEFYYEPGKVAAHPALDRLAFLLAPEGVRIHWITDGRFDRTDVPPQNVFDEPQNRRGPAMLPLRIGDWNHLKLALDGDIASLHLNGELIYQRPLEPTNRRTFGLFYYADQTEARVRNVVLWGGWPRTLPPLAEMELGDDVADSLDADLPRLKAVFTHDFARDGLPEEYFQTVVSEGRGGITPREDGVLAIRGGAENWPSTSLKLPFSAVGDFDMEASFHALKLEADLDSVAMLLANVDDPRQHQCRLLRIRHQQNYQRIEQSLSALHPTGGRSYSGKPLACEAVAGTLRIARRGTTVYYLFAEEDSRAFQCVGTHFLNDAPLKQPGIELHALCHGVGETQILWKGFSLRAEQLKYLPPDAQPERSLSLMNADGGNVRRLTGCAPGFTHLGSPEWSADGKQIALDMSRGSVATSHIILVSAEHGEVEDIGPGCMPSFSPDGKRIAFSHSVEGVMMMNSDGGNREVIDSTGWGVQWSPDGKNLAYGKSGNIVVMDARTRQQRLLLTGDAASRYSYVYWNLGWSHDSRWIAFKAQNRATREYELAAAATDVPSSFQVLYTTTGSLNADFTWSPDNRRVVFSMHSPPHQGTKLFWVDRAASREPQLFPNHPPFQDILGCAWSPDGRQIALASQSHPQPIDWRRELDTKSR